MPSTGVIIVTVISNKDQIIASLEESRDDAPNPSRLNSNLGYKPPNKSTSDMDYKTSSCNSEYLAVLHV